MNRRRRSIPFRQETGVQFSDYRVTPGSAHTSPSFSDKLDRGSSVVTLGSQVTDSEDHPGWRRRLAKGKNGLQDIGGDFFTQKKYVEGKPTPVNLRATRVISSRDTVDINYRGFVWPAYAATLSFPPAINSSPAQLDQLGTEAIARVNPQNSMANLAVAFGELIREGVPRVRVNRWRDEMRAHQNVGDAYLGYQFGLSPLGKEIGTFAAAVVRADELLNQYERDAGRVVRRRYQFPSESVTETIVVPRSGFPFYEPRNSDFEDVNLTGLQTGTLIRQRTTEIRRWFSGAFTYYLPAGYNSRIQMHRKALLAKEILGVDLDLETAWNLAPWSWAVDWFTNAGDVLANVQRFTIDGSLLRYGYIMEHTKVRDTYTLQHPRPFKDKGVAVDSSISLVTETKMRRRATPFGFGLTWNGFSSFQLSILAALGISRAGRL